MKVHEFIDWLKNQDQGAEVLVVETKEGGIYTQGGTAHEVPFHKQDHADYTDYRGNQFVKPTDPRLNTRTLLIGATL